MQYLVTYVERDGVKKTAEVAVHEIVSAIDGVHHFYAVNLGLWGYGKNSKTPEGAIRLLVQDMATILSIQPV